MNKSTFINKWSETNSGKRKGTNENGQGLMEFAISILIFLILIAGIVDLGRAFFTYMALHDAAQEGALYGSINATDIDNIKARVRETANQPIQLTNDDIVVSGGSCQGDEIVVITTYEFPITMPLLGTIVGDQKIDISATARDTILRPECP